MANDSFGLKIGVEGEAEFRSALREINQSFKVLGSEMQLVTSQFNKNDKSIQSVTARNTVLNKEIDAQKNKVETLKSALDNASSSFGENDRRTQNWQIQLNKAQAELIGMERELSDNEKALRDVNRGYNDSGAKVDEFGKVVEESTDDVEKSSNKLEKLGSVLGGISIAISAAFVAVGTAAVGAAKALTDMTVGAAKYADDIITLSAVTGMSTESLQAYRYAAELVDVSLETLAGSMARNIRSMTTARSGTGAAASAYAALGVAVTDATGNLRDSERVYWDTIDALANVSSETERDALAMQLFGRSARDLNPLIAQGSAGIRALTDEAKSMGAVMSSDTIEAFGQFDDSIQRLKAGSDAAKNALGIVLLPQLQVLADDGVGLIGSFTRGLNEAGGDLSKLSVTIGETVGGIVNIILEHLPMIIALTLDIVAAIGSAIMDNLSIIIDAATQIVMTFTGGLIEALPAITEGALKLVLALVDGIVSNLPALVDSATLMIATLAAGIAGALPQLVPAAVSAIAQIVTTLIENLPLMLNAALQLVLGLAEGILTAIPVLIEALPEVISTLVDFFIGSVPEIIGAGIILLTSLIAALPEIIEAIVAAIPMIIDNVITAILDAIPLIIDAGIELLVALIKELPLIIDIIITAIPKIVNDLADAIIKNVDKIIMAGVQLFVSLIENLPLIITELVKAVPQIVNGLVHAFNSYVNSFAEVGTNLIKGLWQGISDAGEWLWNKISGFFGSVVDRIKDFFGIQSPSKLFTGIGSDMGEGIGIGFERAMATVSRDMQNAIPTRFDINSAGARATGTGAGITQNISVVTPKPLSEKELSREFRNLSRKLAMEYVINYIYPS